MLDDGDRHDGLVKQVYNISSVAGASSSAVVESIEDSCALLERTAPHTLEARLEKPQASKKLYPTDKQGKISFKIENKSKTINSRQ